MEGFFGILGKKSLSVTDVHSKRVLHEQLAAYFGAWNRNPTPFAWTKPALAIIPPHRPNVRINDLWLAAQAIHRDFKLLTSNPKDFEDVPGLQIVALSRR